MDEHQCLGDLPPSAKLVYKVLEYDDSLTQKQLIEATLLSARTVRYALERLEECDLVERRVHLEDARQHCYELAGPTTAEPEEQPAEAA